MTKSMEMAQRQISDLMPELQRIAKEAAQERKSEDPKQQRSTRQTKTFAIGNVSSREGPNPVFRLSSWHRGALIRPMPECGVLARLCGRRPARDGRRITASSSSSTVAWLSA